MADQNQQIADTMERLNRELQLYGELTQQTADNLNDAKVGIKGFSAATRMAGGAVEAVGKAATAAAGAMYEGKKGAAAFNDSLTELGSAAKIAAAALALIVPGGPIIKLFVAGLGMAVSATADYVKAANEMADKLYTGYSKMAKTGAAASDGMTGLYNDAKKLGLSMNQLDSYVELVGQNAGDLTLFAGSVFEGRKKFADMGKAMEPFRQGLIAAGYTQEEINDASMQYLRLQTRIGQSQNMTTQQLAEGARKYLVEQDALTKLTGMSRQEQEQALEAARSQQRFRAKLEEMRNSGDARQIAAADEMELTYKMLYKRSKEAAQGYGDLTTGMLGTEAALKVNMSTQGEALVLAERQKAGLADGIQAFEGIGKAVGKSTKEFNMLYQTGVGEEFLLKINEGAELGYAANRDLSAEYNKIREDQKKQGIEGGKAADGITDQYAANIKKQQQLNKEMEDAVFKGIANAQSVTSGLADATGMLTKAFSTLTDGVNKLLNILGLGEEKTAVEVQKERTAVISQDQQNWESASFGEKMQSSVARGLERGARGLGRITGSSSLENLANTAQQQRVASESDYLKKQGRFQSAPPAATNPVITSQGQLSEAGLKVKKGDVQAEESPIDQRIIDMAQQVQSGLGAKFGYFSGFNDRFHQEKSPGSSHTTGMAMDFTLNEKPSKQEGQEIVKYLRNLGADLAIDEYNEPSSKATAGHFHAQINAYEKGGIAETPQIAFVGEKGPEAMIPLQNGAIPIKFEMPTMPDMADETYADSDSESIADMIAEFRSAIKEMPGGQSSDVGGLSELTNMISELIREQRTANDNLQKIYQASVN